MCGGSGEGKEGLKKQGDKNKARADIKERKKKETENREEVKEEQTSTRNKKRGEVIKVMKRKEVRAGKRRNQRRNTWTR